MVRQRFKRLTIITAMDFVTTIVDLLKLKPDSNLIVIVYYLLLKLEKMIMELAVKQWPLNFGAKIGVP